MVRMARSLFRLLRRKFAYFLLRFEWFLAIASLGFLLLREGRLVAAYASMGVLIFARFLWNRHTLWLAREAYKGQVPRERMSAAVSALHQGEQYTAAAIALAALFTPQGWYFTVLIGLAYLVKLKSLSWVER